MLKGLEVEELRDLILSVGTHQDKRRLTPVEVAYLFQKAILSGATLQECANEVDFKGTSMVSRFLKLTKINASIQYLIDWGYSPSTIAFSSAIQLANLPYDEQEDACNTIILNQLNRLEVEQAFQLHRRSGKSMDDCIGETIKMRPKIDRQYVFLGSVSDEALRDYLKAQRQLVRDKTLMEVLQKALNIYTLNLRVLGMNFLR